MNEKHRFEIGLLKLIDLVVFGFAFALTTIAIVKAEHDVSLARFLSMRTRIVNLMICLLALVIFHLVFQLCGLYRSRRLSKVRIELRDVAQALTINTLFFVVLGSIFSISMLTIQFLAVFWLVSLVSLSTCRLLLRAIAAQVRAKGKNLRYMLILGTNHRAVEFANRICLNPKRGYRLLGFVDDEWSGINAFHCTGYVLIGTFADLAEYLRRNVIDEIAIFLPFGSFYKHSFEVANLCQHHGITMRFNSDIFELATMRWRPEEFDGGHYISTYTGVNELWPRTAKRVIDVAGSATALILFAPALLLAATAIKLTSPGPVFFLQERIGLNKRRFKIFKFRTMIPDAEAMISDLEKDNEAGGPVFKMRNDPRITPIGKLLRKTSIDELPQLINVLRGEMSLVGPRPLPTRDYEGFNEDWQRRRFSVTPGITCLWQVTGRSGITFDQWMLLDLQYLDHWSLWLDLKILAKTVPAVLRGTGAA